MLYESFNLIIESQNIELPELQIYTGNKKPDVEIYSESKLNWPDKKDLLYNNNVLTIYNNELRLFIDEIGGFRIINGSKIGWFKINEDINDQYIRTYLLGSAISALLIQRGYLILHGNSLTKNNKTIICLGDTGIGKSTTAFSLMKNGWKLLSDDLVAIDENYNVLPGIPRIKLSRDAINHYSLKVNESKKIMHNINKYIIDGNLISPEIKSSKLTELFFLNRRKEIKGEIEFKCTKINEEIEKFANIRKNLFRPKYVRYLGKERRTFLKISSLIKKFPLHVLTFPNNLNSIDNWSNQL